MDIKTIGALESHIIELRDDLENRGGLLEMDNGDLESILIHAGEIIMILEKDSELLRSSDGWWLNNLKELAVSVHQAMPLRDKIDQLLDIDEYSYIEMLDGMEQAINHYQGTSS